MSQLYETDALAWAERQTELLRQVADGERLDELVDWENVIEEIAAVGRSELHAVEGLLVQAMVHLMKLCLHPASHAARHWRGEIVAFLGDARRSFSPSMRQRIDLGELFNEAKHRLHYTVSKDHGLLRVTVCPFALDDFLAQRHGPDDVPALVAKLDEAAR